MYVNTQMGSCSAATSFGVNLQVFLRRTCTLFYLTSLVGKREEARIGATYRGKAVSIRPSISKRHA